MQGTMRMNGMRGSLLALIAMGALAGCERPLILEGERFPIRADLDASLVTEENPNPVADPDQPENRSEPISLPAPSANADWTHRGGSATHASPHGALSAAPVRVFSANIGAGSNRKNRIASSPVVADGRVFTMDAQALVVATSTSGATLWQSDLVAGFDRDGNVSGGGLAVSGGRVFAATGYGELIALDAASGQIVWRQRLDSAVSGAPAVDGDTVYVATRDGAGYAVNAADGKVKWTAAGLPGAISVAGTSAPAVLDRLVLFPFASGEVSAVLKMNGVQAWAAPVTGQRLGRGYQGVTDVTGDPVVVGGTVYAGTAAGRTVACNAAI